MSYVIDEHNEIFVANLQLSPMFRPFTIMTDLLSGVRFLNPSLRLHVKTFLLQIRTVSILSGSAHSKFETTLQPYMATWLRVIRPFTREMFEVAAFDPNDSV